MIYKITKNNWVMAMLLVYIHSVVKCWVGAVLPDALATCLSAALSCRYIKKNTLILFALTALLSKESSIICVLSLLALCKIEEPSE